MRKIDIFDTTLRDGEQSPGVTLNLSEKVEIAKQLERLGVDIIEAGFPAASNGDFEAVREITKHVRGSSITGLSRTNQSDIDTAWAALKYSSEPRIHLFIATSPIHRQYKLKMSEDEVVEAAVKSIKYAANFFPIIQWSAEDACRTELPFLARIMEEVIQAGAHVINLPDTVGYITPIEYAEVFRYVKEHVPSIDRVKLSTHCHDDLGFAVANSLAAVSAGATQVEGTINGIGERAGNAALEEIALSVYTRRDFYKVETGLVLQEIKRTSDLVSKLTGMMIPPNKAIVGCNAFAHEAGIHQDGMLKEKTTYEIIEPELIGLESNSLVLGKHSGRHAFRAKLEKMGLQVPEEKLNQLFRTFKDLADKKKELTDEDITAIVLEEKVTEQNQFYTLVSIQVQYGTNQIPTATVTLSGEDNQIVQEASTGSGSIEALYNTLERCVDSQIELMDYRIQSVGAGRDALAQVYVKIRYQGLEASGRGLAQDVLESSAKAYLNAVNRAIFVKQKPSLVVG